jgi:hypothetical protein
MLVDTMEVEDRTVIAMVCPSASAITICICIVIVEAERLGLVFAMHVSRMNERLSKRESTNCSHGYDPRHYG